MSDKKQLIAKEKLFLLKLAGINPKSEKEDNLDIALIRRTISQLAFMRVEISEIQDSLIEQGWQDTYQNGATQSGTKLNPLARTYFDLQKLYNQTVKSLKDQIAKSNVEIGDELLDFLKS